MYIIVKSINMISTRRMDVLFSDFIEMHSTPTAFQDNEVVESLSKDIRFLPTKSFS
jgi:hypothetical protein